MTHSKRWLLVLSVSAMACGAVTGLYAQDDLEALLQDLGGQRKKPAAAQPAAPAAEAAPKAEAKPAEPAPAPAPAPAAEPKAEEKPAPAPAAEPKAEEKPAPAPAPAAEPKAEEKPAPAPAPAAEPKAEEKPAPAPAAEPAPAPAAEPAPAPAAEPAAAPAPATPAVAQQDGDTASLISELVTLETIRRKSLDSHGFASLEAARKALAAGDYELARDQYKQAL